MEKQAVIAPGITPSLKDEKTLEKEASVDRLDADITKRLAQKVQEKTDGSITRNPAQC